MSSETARETDPQQRPGPEVLLPPRPPRVWPPVVLLGLFWLVYSVWRWTDVGLNLGFLGFLILLGFFACVVLIFLGWWLAGSRLGLGERLLILAAAVVMGIGTALLSHKTVGPFLLMPGLPCVLTVWTLGLLLSRNWPAVWRRRVLAGALGLTWGAFLLIRTQGMGGDGQFALRWRWVLTPEEKYLEVLQRNGESMAPSAPQQSPSLQAGDWPGFRGPDRDGNLRAVRIATDWKTSPPPEVWRRLIGPAWSSVAVVGDQVFTQEQVGKLEAVVCLDTATGRTRWSHRDAARHEDVQGGAGPCATPTFADGRLFALGATGILNCLQAASGERLWSRDVAADAGTNVPMWGFASSPLVVGDLVVVFAGGEPEKTLLAYRVDSGKPAWAAPAGKTSYSSPHLASIDGTAQILFVSDRGLTAFDPPSGAVLWECLTPAGPPGVPRAIQPRVVGPTRVLFDAGADIGTALIELSHVSQSWSVAERWVSRQIRPSFNDFVVHGDALYGFDARILTCIDLQTGRRRWKEGRYGSGQLLLLGDQPLLLVVGEGGEVVLVAADPEKHQELGRFQAFEGKTWNHPVIAHGRLYVRNAEEIACYQLQLDGPR